MYSFVSRNGIIALAIITLFYLSIDLNSSHNGPLLSNHYIPLITHKDLLRLISENKRVVFVDSREPSEFSEERIPGAYNLPLRNVTKITAQQFTDNDIVIPYCLKDFRGFEVAKALKVLGVKNIYTMASSGLNGWKNNKLPIDVPNTMIKGLALQQLMRCAENADACINGSDDA